MKEWAKREVAAAHGYLDGNIEAVPIHIAVARLVDQLTENVPAPKIADLGCGNGRLYLALRQEMKRDMSYVGYDVNASCIERALETFENSTDCRFICVDLDNPDTVKNIVGYDCVVMDSTINMVANPESLLDMLLSSNNALLLDRVNFQHGQTVSEYTWGGMAAPSIHHSFTSAFFESLAKKHNKTCIVVLGREGNGSVIIEEAGEK